MKSFNRDLRNGYNKFRQGINSSHAFRKAFNTLHEVNNYALPILTAASVVQPELAPVFGGVSAALKGSETIANKIKNKKI